MAFLSKFGNILRQTANKQIRSELSPFKLTINQAIRCMSSMPSSKLFIGGISYQTDEQSLREAFAKYGDVVDARIIMDRDTGRSRGFGFVTFTSSEEASSAIQALDGQDLHGRRVRVNYATDRPRTNFGGDGGGGYGGGGYGGGGYGGGGGGYGGGGGGYGGGSGGYGGGSGGYGGGSGDSYGGGSTGSGYGGSAGGYNSGGNYPSGNSFETASSGGFGDSSNFGPTGAVGGADSFDNVGGADTVGVGGADSSFGSGGAPFRDNPLEANDRDDDDADDFLKRA